MRWWWDADAAAERGLAPRLRLTPPLPRPPPCPSNQPNPLHPNHQSNPPTNQQLLEARDQAKLELFFKSYGAPEAAAMCILLATAGPPQASASVVAHAKAALDNPRLCGEPQLRDGADGGAAPAFGAPAPPAGADDGMAAGEGLGRVAGGRAVLGAPVGRHLARPACQPGPLPLPLPLPLPSPPRL